ncbi:cytochrome c oxidase subunit 3 [Pontibacter mucosus]|uniref:Cytochrome c oxidase subunit 3 n=1 Tax=Pontibacter mucosus TaxID=1649266 RepID=A0A2T5YJ14_9BACT|nr:cytochrome c oxidase subunit 3 [Pontibacter mucosus]PTX19293.1 cytochrome c oxidase subunit 3 [Pontibacter mucosus]
MSTSTTLEAPKSGTWDGGNEPMKASYGKLMMWFFLLSDAFTFGAFLIVYGLTRHAHTPYTGEAEAFTFSTEWWPIPEKVFNAFPGFHGVDLPLAFVALMTMILIFSSVTMVLAVEAGHRMDKKDVEKWLLWTILFGATFLACQAWEWTHFIVGTDEGMLLPDGTTYHGASMAFNQYGPPLFANLFFFITGFHGFHVFIGWTLLIVAFISTVNGVYHKRGHYEMVEKIGLYWHFVDLVWVFVFTFFYLI